MGNDVLKQYSVAQVHAWYERLAKKVDDKAQSNGVAKPMSGTFLRQYIGKGGSPLGTPLQIVVPAHLKADDSVTDVLAFHRAVFLTEKKGRFNPAADRWAGLIPRLQSGAWDGKSNIALTYNSLSDVAPSRVAIGWLFANKPPKKWDIFTSLRGWQLKSSVRFSGTPGDKVAVTFIQWDASGEDISDFDGMEHLTVPNPDYQSMAKDAIAPKDEMVTVHHTNAHRLEAAGLAKPFKVFVNPWQTIDSKLLAPAEIDPKKNLA